jgi:hypothetical protein
LVVIDPTVAVNPTVVAPADAVTLAGTVALALLLDNATARPPPGAAPLKVTVHAEVPGAFTLAGLQVTLLGVTEATRFTVVFAVCAFKVAVTVAVALLLTVPAVAVKAPLLALVAMVMLAGKVSTPLLLERLTTVVLKAALFSVTVQVEACPVPKVLGAQLTLDNCAGATRLKMVLCEALLAVAVRVAI